jgi:hypothetical protein
MILFTPGGSGERGAALHSNLGRGRDHEVSSSFSKLDISKNGRSRSMVHAAADKIRGRIEEAAVVLMDLAAGAVDLEVKPPRSRADLLCLVVECRRRGMELVIRRDAEFRVTSVLKSRAPSIVEFRARASAAMVASGPLLEVIRASVDLEMHEAQYQFVMMEELQGLLARERYNSRS